MNACENRGAIRWRLGIPALWDHRLGRGGGPGYATPYPLPRGCLLRFAVVISAVAALMTMGATTIAPAGPNLWNGATAGMTIDQVAAAVPQAKPATGQVLEDGSQSGLSAPAELAGAPADAVFFFRLKSLSAVLIEKHAMPSGHGPANLAEARRIVALATGQYGAPKSCVDRPELTSLDCVWLSGAIKVAVSYHDIGGGSPSLSVLYRAPAAAERSPGATMGRGKARRAGLGAAGQ